ncbi:hypothetical protein [Arenimonas aestuarii]
MSTSDENMNHTAFNTAAHAIETFEQIRAILDHYHCSQSDETAKTKLLLAAESLAEFEIERQGRAQIIALRAEGMLNPAADEAKQTH